jgi:hypothetical protein
MSGDDAMLECACTIASSCLSAMKKCLMGGGFNPRAGWREFAFVSISMPGYTED